MHDKKTILVPVADGAEEIETTSIVDILRRAEFDVVMASIHQKSKKTPIIQGSRGIGLVCDGYLEDYLNKDFDMIALSGGAGNAENLSKCNELITKLKAQREAKKWYAAMCASPAVVFLPHGLADGEEVTSYPSFKEKFKKHNKYSEERVVVSNNCITSRGPGTAIEFALTLVEKLATKEKAAQLAKGILAYIPK